jgi:predicted Zn-dependent protease
MNVRCPNCSAVFPHAELGPGTVECPLCLLRFEPDGEVTRSMPQGPATTQGAAAPVPDDEFVSFGAPPLTGVQHNPLQTRTTAPYASDDMAKLSQSRGTVPLQGFGPLPTGQDDLRLDGADIDFDSLLSDAMQAVNKPAAPPQARVSAPRSGGVLQDDPVFAVQPPSRPEADVFDYGRPAAAPADDLLFTAPPIVAPSMPTSGAIPGADVDPNRVDALRAERDAALAARAPRRPNAGAKTARKLVRGLATLVVLVLALGGAAQLAGYGWFGSKLWLKQPEKAKAQRPQAKLDLKPMALLDTRKTYEAEVRRLEAVLAARPGEADAKRQLLDRYLDLLERAPRSLEDAREYRQHLDRLAGELGKPPRMRALDGLAEGRAITPELMAELEKGSLDDRGVAVREQLARCDNALREKFLTVPGAAAAPTDDPFRVRTGPEAVSLAVAQTQVEVLLAEAKNRPNLAKFQLLHAAVGERTGKLDGVVAELESITSLADDHAEARALLASVRLEQGDVVVAKGLAEEALRLAEEQGLIRLKHDIHLLVARLAHKKGDLRGMAAALEAAVHVFPSDEVTTLRLGRLLMQDKRSADAQRVFVAAKQAGMKSVAFEVAMVEFWLSVNRSEDAAAEIEVAKKNYPDSPDLLFLHAQVEDKLGHFASAQDALEQVVAKDPKHLRAQLRLAELQAAAGRHEEVLATLSHAREAVGDDETVLRYTVSELLALKRDTEARTLLAKLLTDAPHNRTYLLQAAQLDLKSGQVDRALGYLLQLRDDKALDREGAILLAEAQAGKGKPADAAQTLTPFADADPANVELATQTGRYLVDAKQPERAETLLARAVSTSNSKNAEALFQYGRLAFEQAQVDLGTQRMTQAIEADRLAWNYRLQLAERLFPVAGKPAVREAAVKQLQAILSSLKSYDQAGRPVTKLARVHELMARDHVEQSRYAQALPHLREVTELDADNAAGWLELGKAEHILKKASAGKSLRKALALRPGDGMAAFLLGMEAIDERKTTDAVHWLQVAGASKDADAAEAWYHLALIQRERNDAAGAARSLDHYLKEAKPDNLYRSEAESLKAQWGRR